MKKVNYEEANLLQQIREATINLRLAIQDENFAEESYREVAIERVATAKAHLNTLYKQAKTLVR